MYRLIDTFAEFEAYWKLAAKEPLERQIELWEEIYMSHWPELLHKQQQDYADSGMDWREVARERVFPHFPERLADMRLAHAGLLDSLGWVCERAEERVGLDFQVLFVIYVGIGCGAGWVTRLYDAPACLFGLENAVECGWTDRDSLAGLTAHELGHIVHHELRRRAGLPLCKGPLWQLYEEGFAQLCEHVIMGADTWHQQVGQVGWLEWCQANAARLAAEYASDVEHGRKVNRFFGSWFDIEGWRQCGYYLGHEVVKLWAAEETLEEIALLPCESLEQRVGSYIEVLAG